MHLICRTCRHWMVWVLRAYKGSKSDWINSRKIEKSLESANRITTSHSRGLMSWITVSFSVPGKYYFDLALVLSLYICYWPLSKKSPKQVEVFALWRGRNFTDACFAVRSLKLNKHSCHHLPSFYIQSVRQFPSKLQKLLSGRSRMIYFFQHNILFPLKSNTYQYEVFALYLVNPKNIAVTQGFSDLQEIPLKIPSLS